MQYALKVTQRGRWVADVTVPSAKDAGEVTRTLVTEYEGIHVDVQPLPHMEEGMALPVDHEPHGAISTLRRVLQYRQRTARRAERGYIGADSVDGTDLVTVEVAGVEPSGGSKGLVSGEIVLTKEAAGYAIWALSKSIGLDAEPMLKTAGIEGI